MRRPYDIAIPPHLLKLVQQARISPRGRERPVTLKRRGELSIRSYPWDQMQFGDFFKVALGSTRLDAFRVTVAQQAVRLDCELIIRKIDMGQPGSPVPGVMVTRTCDGLRAIKMKARTYHGISLSISNLDRIKERKSQERRDSYDRLTEQSKNVVPIPKPKPTRKPPPEKPADVHHISGIATESPTYDRAALMAARIAALKDAE